MLKRQHVQKRGFPSPGRAEDRQDVAGRHLAFDVGQKRLCHGRSFDRDSVGQALKGEPHLLALHRRHREGGASRGGEVGGRQGEIRAERAGVRERLAGTLAADMCITKNS